MIEVDFDKKNDARINELLARMLEIHGDPVANRRLHLSQAPGRTVGMTDIHAGHQLMAHNSRSETGGYLFPSYRLCPGRMARL